jgi:chromate transporter
MSLPSLFLGFALTHYLLFMGKGCVSVLLSFGGGDAYLAVADGLFVESGIVSASVFYGDIVSVANILPGSILCKALTAIGYTYGISSTGSIAGGLMFALGGYSISVAASCMIFRIVYYLYEHLSGFRSIKTISHYIGPIVCGLLGTVVLALLVLCKNSICQIM